MTPTEIRAAILTERARQNMKWTPERTCAGPIPPMEKVTVLLEEVGEVARAVLEGDRDNLRDELVQVAAVAWAWLEAL
jgi:NTP pyrophosphatase (non-canonical NTP hydrolase)